MPKVLCMWGPPVRLQETPSPFFRSLLMSHFLTQFKIVPIPGSPYSPSMLSFSPVAFIIKWYFLLTHFLSCLHHIMWAIKAGDFRLFGSLMEPQYQEQHPARSWRSRRICWINCIHWFQWLLSTMWKHDDIYIVMHSQSLLAGRHRVWQYSH